MTTRTLTASFCPCFFVDGGDLFDIWDNLPVPIGTVLAEEIDILMPIVRLLQAIDNAK